MLKLKFFIPEAFKETEEIKKIQKLLTELKSKQFVTSAQIISEIDENTLKSQFLWSLAVYRKIKIKQSQKSKLLYPILIVFDNNDKALTFYPQSRGENEVTIKEFLSTLSKNKIKSIHEKEDIEQGLDLITSTSD